MSIAKTADVLLEMVAAIVGSAKEQGLVVFYGSLDGTDQKTVHWEEEHGGDWRKFLECAKDSGVKMVYVSWGRFEESQVDKVLEQLESNAFSQREPTLEHAASMPSRTEIEAYKSKTGLTMLVDAAFVHEGAAHFYQHLADWFQVFENLTEELEDSDESEEPPGGRVVDKDLIKKWAAELANHAKFGTARTRGQREFLLENIAGVEFDTLPVVEILDRADSMYQFEIKEKEDQRIRAEALLLKGQGFNLSAIAQRLGIAKDRISGLLSGRG